MSKTTNYLTNLLIYLVYLFPFTFIFGNLFTNIFIFFIGALGIVIFKRELLIWNHKISIILILLFFFLILISTINQIYFFKKYPDWVKSVLYIRFFLLLIVIKAMVYKKVINLNKFIYICFFISSIISLDILIQFFLGYDLVGNVPITFPGMVYYTGFFNKELIAGGFILMFASLGIFAIPLLLKNQKKYLITLLFLITFSLFAVSLLLAGNRMPVIMFAVFAVILSIIIKNKEYKKRFLFISFLVLFISTAIFYKSEMINKRFKSFFIGIPNPTAVLSEALKEYPKLDKYKDSGIIFSSIKEFQNSKELNSLPFYTGHVQIFITSTDLIIDNPLIGKGIKSYRNNCSSIMHLPNRVCESHPHNFYLDILNDSGFLGLVLILIPVLILLFNTYKEYLKGEERNNNISNWIYLAIIMSTLIQFFPFKSSGSFFSTFNSAYTFLILGFLLGLNEMRYKSFK